jgi:hypothetical protein
MRIVAPGAAINPPKSPTPLVSPVTTAKTPSWLFGRFKRLEKPRWVSRLLATPATLRPFQRSLQRAIVFSLRPSEGVPPCLKIRAVFQIPA